LLRLLSGRDENVGMGYQRSVSRTTGVIVAVVGLWGMFVFCMGLGFVTSFMSMSVNSSAELTGAERRSLIIEWTIAATIGATVLLIPAAVASRRARSRGACADGTAEHSSD
jgi:hypothetical protein